VDKVTVKTLDGNSFEVKANTVVVAAGGLENPRLLLLNDIGNQNDLVGRYFMDHIIFSAATLLLRGNVDTDFYQRAPISGTDIKAGLSLRSDVLAKEGILNSWSALRLKRSPAILIDKDWASIKSALSEGEFPDGLSYHVKNILRNLRQLYANKWSEDDKLLTVPIQSFSEQSPNPLSRVTLDSEVDALGQRRIALDWRITDLERKSIRRTQEIIAAEIGRSNLGRVQVLVPAEQDVWTDPGHLTDTAASLPVGSFHHMGTTRMHADPKQGVVDENCRVHGTKNLYIAGSSVFPTCGFENPTLTIVAMTYRLADHLRSLA
jgi:choline dehydrogenase-like flavoprotein